jgi:alcohol dehydrogenase
MNIRPNHLTPSYSIARLPEIHFGNGCFTKIPELIEKYGKKTLVVTGNKSFEVTKQWSGLIQALRHKGIEYLQVKIKHEPSPELIDEHVHAMMDSGIQSVVGIGGGSVLDAAKAIAGLLPFGNSVMDHLEGVGPELPYTGPPLPFIAVPTTAGTGSEATKNSVLSKNGINGFKKSFRDDQLVPDYAIVDPELLKTCPPELIAANAMDAFTQLLESYVSLRSNPFTDALALDGMASVRDGMIDWYDGNTDTNIARNKMAYASLLSGITLAQTGLGSVHGLASPLGAFFPIPHGVVCGTLLATATRFNIDALQEREPDNHVLQKYAFTGRILSDDYTLSQDAALTALISQLEQWTTHMKLERLADYGVTKDDFTHIVNNCRGSSMKTNPIKLTDEEITRILDDRL